MNSMTNEQQPADQTEAIKFTDLDLPEAVLQAVSEAGYTHPTPIQASTIPLVLSGADVLGQAQTGTGKTAAFALPLIAKVDVNKKHPQILVLAPTRELAVQVADSFRVYGAGTKNLKVASIFGGTSYQTQIRSLQRGAQVVVGTPGRVMDHMRQGTLNISQISCLVLDEADEMLRMGFIDDVEFVLSHAPEQRQIALFSATMPGPIQKIADRYLVNPKVVKIAKKRATADTVEQQFVVVHPRDKFEAFARILEVEATDGVIVFVKTKIESMEVAEKLNGKGFKASPLNGDMVQANRQRTVDQLKSGHLDILVATDVAARGLDVQRVSHVINYDLPFDSESYVHRIGRTGRAGREGKAILILAPRETRGIRSLQRDLKITIQEVDLPSVEKINEHRIAAFQKKVLENAESDLAGQFLPIVTQLTEESGLPAEKIAASIAAISQGKNPLLAQPLGRRPARHNDGEKRKGGFQKFRVGVGRRGGVSPKNLVGAIAGESTFITGRDIGQIDIFDSYSTVDLPSGMDQEILAEMDGVFVSGKPMNLSVSTDPDRRRPRSGFSGPGRRSTKRQRRRNDGFEGEGAFRGRGSGKPEGKKSRDNASKSRPAASNRIGGAPGKKFGKKSGTKRPGGDSSFKKPSRKG